MGSLLLKKDKISIPEAHVDKKFKEVFSLSCIKLKIKVKKNQSKLEIFNFCHS